MVRVERLLQFVGQLQNERSALQRRSLLLRYIRKMLSAQFVALFALDKTQQELLLKAYSGRRPDIAEPISLVIPDAPSDTLISDGLTIPLNGLFGSALSGQGLFPSADLSIDERALPNEKALSFPGGPALLSVIRTNGLENSDIGLLFIAFAEDKTRKLSESGRTLESIENEGDLLICITLLSAYLSVNEEGLLPPRPRRQKPVEYDEVDRALSELLRNRRSEQLGTLPELLYSLSSISDLYELGLIIGTDVDVRELYQNILTALGRIVLAQGSSLLLYEAAQKHFVPAASQGQDLPYDVVATSLNSQEMERLALRGPGETITSILLGEQRILLVTLSCNCLLLGVVALAIEEDDRFSEERSLLLSYMGNVAALLLKNHELRMLEMQEAIEQEQQRIARDLHDGPVQNVAHVLHRLEHIQHLLDADSVTLPELVNEVRRTYLILETGLDTLRQNMAALLPLELEEQGFDLALEGLMKEFRQSEPQLEITYQAELPAIQSSTLQGAIFRCIQEALNNVRKHAYASHVFVRLRSVPNALLIEVHDDGVGFQPETPTLPTKVTAARKNGEGRGDHFGLRSMEDRVKSVGGNLEITSEHGNGTLLKARFPLPQQDQLLTNREREILRLVSQGFTNSRIALDLAISRETVKSHVHHIMQKLHAHDRTHAAIVAVRQGWL